MNDQLIPLGEAALHWLAAWSVVVFAIVIWRIVARPRRATVRYAAALVATFAGLLLVPIVLCLSPRFTWRDVVNHSNPVSATDEQTPTEEFVSWFSPSRDMLHEPISPGPTTPIAGNTATSEASSPELTNSPSSPASRLSWWVTAIAGAYALGVCLGLIRLRLAMTSANCMRRESTPATSAELVREFETAVRALDLRRPVRLAVHPSIPTPVCMGGRTATVLWPASNTEQMTSCERRAALVHELAHLRRRDDWVNLAAELWRSLAWFFLPIHALVRALRREQEFMCDDVAAGQFERPQSYAQLLLNVSTVNVRVGALCTAFAGPGIKLRIRRLLDSRFGKLVPLRRTQLVALAIVGALLVVAASSVRLVGLAAQTPGGERSDAELPATTPKEIGDKIADSMKTYARGLVEVQYDEERDTNSDNGDGKGPRMIRFPGRFRYASDGTRWRGEFEGVNYSQNTPELTPRGWSGGFDGDVHFYEEKPGDRFVIGEHVAQEGIPLPSFFWSTHSEGFPKSLRERAWQMQSQETVDGYRCYTLALEFTTNGGTWREELTVSPRQNYLPVRYKTFYGGKLNTTHELGDLAQSESGRWYPRNVRNTSAGMGRAVSYRVTLYESNRQFGDAYFRPEITPGAGVIDYRAGYAYRNDPWWPEMKPLLRERFNWPPIGIGWVRELRSANEPAIEGQPAPPITAQEWIHGIPMDLATLRGKVILLCFSSGSVWGPDPQWTAGVKGLYGLYHPLGLEVVEVIKHTDDTAAVKQRARELEVPWPVAIDSRMEGAENGKTFAAYKTTTYLSYILIDHEGKVRLVPEGKMAEMAVDLLTAAGVRDVPKLPPDSAPSEVPSQLQSEWVRMLSQALKSAKIAGQVTDAKGNLSGATVEGRLRYALNLGATDVGGTHSINADGNFTTTTGEDGRYELGSLPKGTYTVTYQLPGRARVQQRMIVAPESTSTIQANADLSQADGLSGRVIDELLLPVAGAVVKIARRHHQVDRERPFSIGDSGRPITTDENGRFAFENMLTGAYTLEISHEKFGFATKERIPAGTKDLEIRLDPNATPPVDQRGRGGRRGRGPSPAAAQPAPAAATDIAAAKMQPVPAQPAAVQPLPGQTARTNLATTKGQMLLTVVGPEGEPIEGASVHFNIAPERPPIINHHLKTDRSGVVIGDLPPSVDHLKLWVRKEGFVSRFGLWFPRFQADAKEIPHVFTVQLAKGTTIGGVIKNEDGTPLAGAKVEVQLVRPRGADGMARLSDNVWLAEEAAIVTKSDGRWSINNVPAGETTNVLIKLTHAEHVSDDEWGGLQRAQNVTMRALRDQSAAITMPPGISVTGTVKDAAGRPVAGAVVVSGEDPEFQEGSQEVITDAQGAFRTSRLRPGPASLTIVAPNFAPVLRKIEVSRSMEQVEVSLSPGKALRVRFIDSDGKPVPGVRVLVAGWRNIQSLHNSGHPEVVDMRIPARAEADGKFEWSWAPHDEVIYHAVGYDVLAPDSVKVPYQNGGRVFRTALPLEVFRLTADGNEHMITLRRRQD